MVEGKKTIPMANKVELKCMKNIESKMRSEPLDKNRISDLVCSIALYVLPNGPT